MITLNDIPAITFTEATTVRLISTAYIDEPAMAPLVDSDDELSLLEELEKQTSARHLPRPEMPGGITEAELVTESHGYGWTYINAAFCYARIPGNRFNGPERGAWYAAFGDDAPVTAQQEVAYHLTRALDDAGVYENVTAYRELLAGFTADFHDLRGFGGEPFLDADPVVGYPAGQVLARTILDSDGKGVLYPSIRKKGGQCLAAFRPSIVQNVRQGSTWILEWSGSKSPRIHLKP